ncbi:MAG: ComF family protein [Chromatiales bacterium]|jgi:ComF family protein
MLLYPPVCLLCGAPGAGSLDICEPCRDSLPRPQRACRACGIALPAIGGGLCGRCQRRPPRYDAITVPYVYADPTDWLIQRLKFQARLAHARLLGRLLARAVEASDADRPECLIPVPLHSARLRERGFNQAAEIARHAGRVLGISLDTRSVRRSKPTEAQMGLSARGRRANVRGVFEVCGATRLAGRHVAVVDDVVTTGSTVEELARVLKRAGTARVDVWACARA